jgi:zinc transport system substrate-binding protein
VLDRVFAYKAARADDKTAQAYKEYYETGYQTQVDRIVIQGDTVSFYRGDDAVTGTYDYDGYEVLTYKAGNRGVRYVFELEDDAANANPGLPDFIQFSDHSIFPTQAGHFHLYWGDDREALLNEVTNWPTYYPSKMSGDEVAEEMMSH